MLPLRHRLWPILAVYFGAPVCAEYLQAYLSATGNLLELVGGLLIFGPLYGGAALLIREIAVRTGRGWRGVLLLAAAFGVAMPGLIDLSLLGQHQPGIPYWEQFRAPTLIAPLGLSVYPTLSWVTGHVLMSVGAPLALLHALAPKQRGQAMLGRPGLVVVAALAIVAAVFVHLDGRHMYGYTPGLVQVVGVSLAVLTLNAIAFTRWGRPVTATAPAPSGSARVVPPAAVLLGALAAKLATDVLPSTWGGVAGLIVLVATGFATMYWLARTWRWDAREIGLLGAAAVIGATLSGFLTPAADGVSPFSKYAQNTVLLLLAAGLTALVFLATTARRTPAIPPTTTQ